jgi:hypothetical protein
MYKSDGITSLSKRNFWKVFKKAWDQAFTKKNITYTFAKTGIYLQNLRLIMAQIEPKEPPKPITPLRKPYNKIKTPYSVITLQRIKKIYRIKLSTLLIDKILKANETLYTYTQIAEYRYKGFQETLKNEKAKRKHNKRLDLKEEVSTGTTIWSSKEVTKARAYYNEKEALEE